MNTLIEFYQHLGWALSLLVMMTFLLAGMVKGVIGLGLPTVAMGLLGLAIAPAQAAALLIIPSMVTNAWQLAAGGQLAEVFKRLWPMQLGIVIGTAFGVLWLPIDGGSGVVRALGMALLVYALSGLFVPALHIAARHERWLGPMCGLITGGISSATGVFVIPAVPYLHALGIGKNQLVQALGLSFGVATLALAAGLYWRGTLGGVELNASVLALLPAMLGVFFGQWLRERISARVFKRVFFIGMALLGAHLLIGG